VLLIENTELHRLLRHGLTRINTDSSIVSNRGYLWHKLARIFEWIRDWLLRFIGVEISKLDAIGLSNCPKLSDNRRIKTVEYTVALEPIPITCSIPKGSPMPALSAKNVLNVEKTTSGEHF